MTTICEQLDLFLADMVHRRRLQPNTIRAYRADLGRAVVALPMVIADITVDNIETLLADAQVKPGTRNRRAASLGRFFTWAQRRGLCNSNLLLFRDQSLCHVPCRTQFDRLSIAPAWMPLYPKHPSPIV
ncbi:site-specific integrase [Herpetosiphon llansteffanensis]